MPNPEFNPAISRNLQLLETANQQSYVLVESFLKNHNHPIDYKPFFKALVELDQVRLNAISDELALNGEVSNSLTKLKEILIEKKHLDYLRSLSLSESITAQDWEILFLVVYLAWTNMRILSQKNRQAIRKKLKN